MGGGGQMVEGRLYYNLIIYWNTVKHHFKIIECELFSNKAEICLVKTLSKFV